jgi:Cof subfamily protein (haloacid dehalogenase superfamily)
MVNKKLLFFDIDGTLVNEDTLSISESTKLGIKKAKENGHLVFVNTGRPPATVPQIIKDLNIDGFVCGCGTFVSYQDTILYEKTMPNTRCLEIVRILEDMHIEAILEAREAVYFTNNIKTPKLLSIKEMYINNNFCLLDIHTPTITFDKFTIWFDSNNINIEDFLKQIPEFTYMVRDCNGGEVIPNNHSKATGIQFLSDYFNIPLDDCYVFGDSYNDAPMLEYVTHAIVMGNGDPALFKHAYYVTKDIHEDGIYHALEHLELI